MSQIPYWTLPQFCWPNRIEYPPTWRVVFLLPLEDAELDQFMKRLVVVDNDWPDRPDAEPRRLLEMPWLYDIIPDTSIIAPIFTRGRKEPLIFVDTQSKEDDTAIIAYQVEGQENPQSLRVPINRANLLLSAAVEGKVVLDGQEFQPLEYESSAIMKQGERHTQGGDWTIFVIESMTPEEFQRLEKYAEERMDDQFEYCEVIHVADQIKSPDIKGLVEWFESPECFLSEPPSFFIALDRWSLQVADDANSDDDAVDFWAECIIGYDRAGEYVLRDENEYCYATWTAGIKYDRFSFEDGLGVCMRIDQDKCEILGFYGSEVLYWKWMQSFAEKTPRGMEDEAFESPKGRAYWPSVEWDK